MTQVGNVRRLLAFPGSPLGATTGLYAVAGVGARR